jgi:hypothetical protein
MDKKNPSALGKGDEGLSFGLGIRFLENKSF